MFSYHNYRIGIEWWGLILFLVVMIPNIIWFKVPAPNDIMRQESRTPRVDKFMTVFQAMLIITLILLKNVKAVSVHPAYIVLIGLSLISYYTGWIIYYRGISNAFIHIVLADAPCLAFILFAVLKKNLPALTSGVLFTATHTYFAVVNFVNK